MKTIKHWELKEKLDRKGLYYNGYFVQPGSELWQEINICMTWQELDAMLNSYLRKELK